MKNGIKLFIMDVDGTMTDGKIYMGSNGEVMKAFDIQDGYGIHELLPANGIKTAIVTGRKSQIVENRAKELEVDYVMQGIGNKKIALEQLSKETNISLNEMLYIGDDCMDICAMKICGFAACPSNAVKEVKDLCNYVCSKKGGEGAIRECIEWILKG